MSDPNTMTGRDSVDSRLSRVETSVDTLSSMFQRYITHAEKRDDDLHADLRALGEAFNMNTRTQWGPLASWAAVVVAIVTSMVALAAWGPIGRLDRTERDHRELSAGAQIHHEAQGHPYVLEKVRSLEANIARLADATVQEQARIRGIVKDSSADLDKRLQTEMRLLDANQDTTLRAINERLTVVENWQRQNNVSNTARLARIEALVELRGWATQVNRAQ